MDSIYSQIFLYLASIYIISGLLLNIFRRLNLPDFLAYILSGVVFAGIILGWGKVFGPENIRPFEDSFKITEKSIENLRSLELPDTVLEKLTPLKERIFTGEDLFVDTLAANLGLDQVHSYKPRILKYSAVEPDIFKKLIFSLSNLGILLFLIQLGFNFDASLLKSGNKSVPFQAISFILLNTLVMGAGSYFFFFEQNPGVSILLAIAFLCINAGVVLSVNFPVTLSTKIPLKNLLQLAVILDIFAIGLFAGINLFFRYENSGLPELETLFISVTLLLIFIIIILSPGRIENIFNLLNKLSAGFAVFLKTGLVLLFLYAGYRVGISILLLGIWAGILIKIFAGASRMEVEQRLFPLASFFYIIPFVEIGRPLVLRHAYAHDFWFQLFVLLSALVVISLLMALFVVRRKGVPPIMFLGTFPRGEMAAIILWLLKSMGLISNSIFVVSMMVVIISCLSGSLLARIFFARAIGLKRKSGRA